MIQRNERGAGRLQEGGSRCGGGQHRRRGQGGGWQQQGSTGAGAGAAQGGSRCGGGQQQGSTGAGAGAVAEAGRQQLQRPKAACANLCLQPTKSCSMSYLQHTGNIAAGAL